MTSCQPAHLPLLDRETVKLVPFGSTKVVLALVQGVVEEWAAEKAREQPPGGA